MSEQIPNAQSYSVNVSESEDRGGQLVFTFVPTAAEPDHGSPGRSPQFIVAARQEGNQIAFDWGATHDDPESAAAKMEEEARERIGARALWIQTVTALVDQVEAWAKELQWSTRRIEKKIEDAWIGDYRVPALLMQAETCRIMLEPVGRSTLGTDGVVDLYLLPAYDDIASLHYYGGRWNLHYMFANAKPAASVRATEPLPLTKETLERVLAEIRRRAA